MLIESLAPTHVNWGLDNRLAMLRYPAPRGKATRLEVRLGDGSAAIHNAVASVLFAGIDGLERKLELPPQCAKLPYEDEDTLGPPLPSSLGEALDALAADDYLSGQMGDRLIEIYQEIKRYELGRWEQELARVTDWERAEYAHHL